MHAIRMPHARPEPSTDWRMLLCALAPLTSLTSCLLRLSAALLLLQGGASLQTSRLEYHWYRSTEKMACSWCGKTPVTMQRLTDSSYYCGIGCFVSAWRGHAAQHRTGLTQRGPRSDDVNEWANPEAEGEGKTTEQKWIEVADTQSYTPSVDDVGHMLKLACVPYSSDGSKKGIAKTLKTSYVIAPPPSPTPRRMMMVRNNVAVSVGKPGTARTNSSRCVPP